MLQKWHTINLLQPFSMIKVITTVSDPNNEGYHKLIKSLREKSWDYMVIVNQNINWNWSGFKDIYEWCLTDEAKNYTHFLYTDGFDTLAVRDASQFNFTLPSGFIFSTEKQCFPRKDWEGLHPKCESEWQYLNHGQFIAEISQFLKYYEGVFDKDITCQEYAMDLYLKPIEGFNLDTKCEIFQTLAFESEGDFLIEDKVIMNTKTGKLPFFIHGNGRTDMTKFYNSLC